MDFGFKGGARPLLLLNDMLTHISPTNADTILWCSDGRVLGHKCILSQTSPYLASLLALSGSEPANIILAEESRDEVELLVRLAYMGKCFGTPKVQNLGSRLGVQVDSCYCHIS